MEVYLYGIGNKGDSYMYIGHKREDGTEQPLIDHLLGTAEAARNNAMSFGNGTMAYLCGMLHDIGKYSDDFQNRIKNDARRCDHSTAGAKLAFEKNPVLGKLMAYCIAGHHSGLLNCGSQSDVGGEGTLYGRLSDSYHIPDYSAYGTEVEADFQALFSERLDLKIFDQTEVGFSIAFLIRMVFSALVDGDFLDTEAFMSGGAVDRNTTYDFPKYHEALLAELERLSAGGEGPINAKRREITEECQKAGRGPRGLYTLTVPTGGGKTLSSMLFALEQVLANDMERIIYVIPYTSIIEQNAKVFKDIFGEAQVLEHHANFDFDDTDPVYKKLKLQTENWDVPIVVTTNVQFFESLYGNRTSKCRKLHNIANSVIIFDEVQMFPTNYLVPCTRAIAELVYNCRSTAVLCSATLPNLRERFPESLVMKEISTEVEANDNLFKRAKVIRRGTLTLEALAAELSEQRQCLCIVNTRKHALALYEALDCEGKYHLSTLMYPAHRKRVIKEIRGNLKNGEPCIVISTRLIEAGVDVDFPRVYRSLAGLDAIVQAGGRCNREGKLCHPDGSKALGEVHVFEPEGDYARRQPPSFSREGAITQLVMAEYEDIFSPEAIEDYFTRLYDGYLREENLDSKRIVSRLNDKQRLKEYEFDFKDIAQDFKLIEQDSRGVIIPHKEIKKEIEQLGFVPHVGKLLRKLQSYTVNVYENEFDRLNGSGKLKFIGEGIAILRSMEDYDQKLGLDISETEGIGIYM